jgi:ParB family transcriptional regulator, chromosome partitioning protein
MARKNLLTELIAPKLPAGNSTPEHKSDKGLEPDRLQQAGSVGSRGAIGAVTRSIQGLKSAASEAEQIKAKLASGHAVVELDPALCDPSPIVDRIADDRASPSELIELIRASGQQVPILARPHPDTPGRYQIAYGHRRVGAARALGRPVRAVIRQLTDAELVIAQGQENSARRDLSFIERALYAARLEEAGFDRETIMAALNVDKTGLSRLISAAVKIPRDLIEAIGPAPKVGRDRWMELAAKLESGTAGESAREIVRDPSFAGVDTDARFELVLKAVQAPPRSRAKSGGRPLTTREGRGIGRIERAGKGARLILTEAGFTDFLVAQLPDLYEAFGQAVQSRLRPQDGGEPNGAEQTRLPELARAAGQKRSR